ncbi:MAG: hypothetical protein ACHQT9_04470 [Candidatus Saccharimonadales bacterium]
MMKTIPTQKMLYAIASTVGVASLLVIPASALSTKANTTAATGNSSTSSDTTTKTPATTGPSAAQIQAHVTRIIARGTAEIDRRIASLTQLSGRLSGAKHLTSDQIAGLNSTINTNIDNLKALKTKLASDASISDPANALSTAQADAKSIINSYRIYALIIPQIQMIRAADDQQVGEAKLAQLSTKLGIRITTAQAQGKDVTSLTTSLDDLNSKVTAAQGISSTIESDIIGIQPNDYNSNHTVLSSFQAQLKTAHADIAAAIKDAQAIVTGLKSL